jgi:16S rRNA (guanine527-N7)-methyltransferase
METTQNRSSHRVALEGVGLAGPTADRLASYLDLLAEWRRRVNLTGARNPRALVEELVQPAVAMADQPQPGRLIDVGSGNGSPGLVLAILRPDLQVTLLEPRVRRWAFLREAARVTGCETETLRLRHDEYRGEPAQTVTIRALALPLAALAPLVVGGGQLLVLGGTPHPEGPFVAGTPRPLPKGILHVFQRLEADLVSRET